MNIKKIKENKLLYSILFVIILVIIIIGVTYAFFQVQKTSTSITGDVNCYTINYTKGQDISGELVMGTTYDTGHSTDVIMYTNPNCERLTGTLYLTTNNTTTMDLTDEALRYSVVVNNSVVSTGKVDGTANQVIYSNFALNTTSTTYKVYIWLDSTKEDMNDSGTEVYDGFIHAEVLVSSQIGS